MKVLIKCLLRHLSKAKQIQYPEISHILDNSPWQSGEANGHISFCYSHPDVITIAVGTSPNQKIRNNPDTLLLRSGYCF